MKKCTAILGLATLLSSNAYADAASGMEAMRDELSRAAYRAEKRIDPTASTATFELDLAAGIVALLKRHPVAAALVKKWLDALEPKTGGQ